MQRAVFSMGAQVCASEEARKFCPFPTRPVPVSRAFDPNPFLRGSQCGLCSSCLFFFLEGERTFCLPALFFFHSRDFD